MEKSPKGELPSPASHLLAMLSKTTIPASEESKDRSTAGVNNNTAGGNVHRRKSKGSVVSSTSGATVTGSPTKPTTPTNKTTIVSNDASTSGGDGGGAITTTTDKNAAPFINTKTLSSTFRNRIKAIAELSPLHSPSVPNFNFGKSASGTKQVFFFGDDDEDDDDGAKVASGSSAIAKDEWPKGVTPKGYIKAFPFDRTVTGLSLKL
jgi:hypothetical protein